MGLPAEEAFFRRLPRGELLWLENKLQSLLVEAAQVAAELLPKGGEVSLQRWVERRASEAVHLGTDAAGLVVLLVPDARKFGEAPGSSAERAAPESSGKAFLRGLTAPASRTPLPPPDRPPPPSRPPSPPPAQPPSKTNSEVAFERWVSEVPEDSCTEAEEAMREHLLEILSGWKERRPPSLKMVAQNPGFQAAKRALKLPPGVTLLKWIDRRIGGELETMRCNWGGNNDDIAFGLRGPHSKWLADAAQEPPDPKVDNNDTEAKGSSKSTSRGKGKTRADDGKGLAQGVNQIPLKGKGKGTDDFKGKGKDIGDQGKGDSGKRVRDRGRSSRVGTGSGEVLTRPEQRLLDALMNFVRSWRGALPPTVVDARKDRDVAKHSVGIVQRKHQTLSKWLAKKAPCLQVLQFAPNDLTRGPTKAFIGEAGTLNEDEIRQSFRQEQGFDETGAQVEADEGAESDGWQSGNEELAETEEPPSKRQRTEEEKSESDPEQFCV